LSSLFITNSATVAPFALMMDEKTLFIANSTTLTYCFHTVSQMEVEINFFFTSNTRL